MDDITKKPYTAWLEEALKTIVETGTKKICVAAILPNGEVFTGYYNADATYGAIGICPQYVDQYIKCGEAGCEGCKLEYWSEEIEDEGN